MSEEYQKVVIEEEEITLKELFLKIGEFRDEVKKNLWLVIVLGLLLGAVFFYRTYSQQPNYIAKTTFTLTNSEKSENSNAAVSGLLGQFGFGGNSGGNGLNIPRILALANTREIVEQVLFEKVEMEGTQDYIANHIIHIYDLQKKWGKNNKALENFTFSHAKLDSFSRLENSVLKKLHNVVAGTENSDKFLSFSFEEIAGIFSMMFRTHSEELSLILLEKEYKVLSEYYIQKTIEPQQRRYNSIKTRHDSIVNVLRKLDYNVASYNDKSYGLIEQTSNLQGQKLKRDQQFALITYNEVKKNLEAADFALKSITPVFQPLDEAILPLPTISESTRTALFTGTLLGGFIAILFIVVRKIYRDTMNS